MARRETGEPTSEAQLGACIDNLDPTNRRLFRSVRTALRRRFPAANELAYDYGDAVVISYSPSNNGIDGILALRGSTDGVFLYFSQGPQLPDPKKLLQGSARTTRFIQLESASRLKNPDVEALIMAALGHAKTPFPTRGKGSLILKSSAAKKKRTPGKPAK
ncbi:MAG TPA: hypothetical protein VF720_15725 [Candidatus Eisenbacteria bacterium]